MKKKIHLQLEALKVQSFVTSLKENELNLIKGGTEVSCPTNCPTDIRTGCQITDVKCDRTVGCVTNYPEACTAPVYC